MSHASGHRPGQPPTHHPTGGSHQHPPQTRTPPEHPPGSRRPGDPDPQSGGGQGGGHDETRDPNHGGDGGLNIDVGGITIGGGGDDGDGGDGSGSGGGQGGPSDDGGSGWDGGGTPSGQVGGEGRYPLPTDGGNVCLPGQGSGGAGDQTSGDPADFEAAESRLEQAAQDFETAGDRLADLGRRLADCLGNDSLTSSAAGPAQEIADKIHEISGKLASGLATTGHRLGDQGRALRQADQSSGDRMDGLGKGSHEVTPPATGGGSGGSGGPSGGGGGAAGGGPTPSTPSSPDLGGAGGGGGGGSSTGIDSVGPPVAQAPAPPVLGGAGGGGAGAPADLGYQPDVLIPTPVTTEPAAVPDPGTGADTGAGSETGGDAGTGGDAAEPARPLVAGSGLEIGLRAEAHALGLSGADTDQVVTVLESHPHGEQAAETIASGRYDDKPGFKDTVSMLANADTAPAAMHQLDLAAKMSDHGVDDLSFAPTEGRDGTRSDTALVARGGDGQSYAYRFKDLDDPSQLVRTAQKELLQTTGSGADHQVLWLHTSGSLDDLRADGTLRQLTELYSRQRAQFVVETDTGRVGVPAGGRFFPWNEDIS
ncbi:WXG100 family type VII secretion target [Streptomyces sp. NPDC092296]|uniref:WXG100 family type VII secretion target n=1 Tax=Streptomyces sp. NPDC092296 TaxID=3366012 RepID=UPI00382D313F